MSPLGEASGSGWCLKQGERVSSMESERWGSFPILAPPACQNSNAQPTPHSYFCGRCTCFPGEFTLAMQMCFAEASALCCVTEHRIKQCLLFGAFLKCAPRVTVKFSDGAKSVNTMILIGKNTSYPPYSHSLFESQFCKILLYLWVKYKVTHLCDFCLIFGDCGYRHPLHQWQAQGSSGKNLAGDCTEVLKAETFTPCPTKEGLKINK